MSVLNSVSALMRALAVYFNDSGHVPLSECLLSAFIAFSAWFSFSSADSVWL